MELNYTLDSSLPKLAWLVRVDWTLNQAFVRHGSYVETRSDFFVEGVWNGAFSEGAFDTTDCIFGTGCIKRGESLRFVSSATTTDYLYYCRVDSGVVVANSLPLLLASQGAFLDPRLARYDRINDSIVDGIADYTRQIPTSGGDIVRLIYNNLDVSAGAIRETHKELAPPFTDYSDYLSYIASNYALIARNIRDPERKLTMQIFSTQSKGYDSTAVNAITARHGIDKVFTITTGKSNTHFATRDSNSQVDDDGTEIGRQLGLNCVPLDRRHFAVTFANERFYYAALHYPQDSNFDQMTQYISGVTVVLTGILGEMWYTATGASDRPSLVDDELRRWDLAGHGLSELRLVVGFIQLPLIYIGARRRADILRITESAEMLPWRLDNAYDRPIPRRIAEEAGVSREAFGQQKVGSVVLFPAPSLPYGSALREEFRTWLLERGLITRAKFRLWPIVHYINTIVPFASADRYALVYQFQRVLNKLGGPRLMIKPLWKHLDAALFCFCVNKCARDYERGAAGPGVGGEKASSTT